MEWKLVALSVGILLFLIVLSAVVWLVVKHPINLLFSEASYVQFTALVFGEKGHPITGPQLEGMRPQDPPNPPVGQLEAPNQTE